MIPFAPVFREELRLLLSRGSARAALVLSVLIGVLAVLAAVVWRRWAPEVPPGVPQVPRSSAVFAAGLALNMRNFFVLPLLLAHATAASFAGDHADRTLRELLLSPVSRTRVLTARWSALATLAAACGALTLAVSLLVGAPLLGLGEPLGRLLLGYCANVGSDLGLLAAASAVALWSRGPASALMLFVLGLGADFLLRQGLRVLGGLVSMGATSLAFAPKLVPFTFGAALACWEGWDGGFVPSAFVGLFVWTLACVLVARYRFEHTETP
jgi:hypothetical protein